MKMPQLLVKGSDGSWLPHDSGVDSVIAELLPWDLRDFFVMDADEAADYVGGSENKLIQRQEVIAKTSFAVRALLGMDVFEKAADRVRTIAVEFGRASTKAIGDEDLNRKQEELDQLRAGEEELKRKVEDDRRKMADIEDRLERARGKLEALVESIGAHDQLKERLKENRERRGKADKETSAGVRRTFKRTRSGRTPRIAGSARSHVRAKRVTAFVRRRVDTDSTLGIRSGFTGRKASVFAARI